MIFVSLDRQKSPLQGDQIRLGSGAKFVPKFGLGQIFECEEDDHPLKSLNLYQDGQKILSAKNQYRKVREE